MTFERSWSQTSSTTKVTVVRRVGTMVMERLTTVPRRGGSQQTSQESQDLELSFIVKVESEATCDGFRFMV